MYDAIITAKMTQFSPFSQKMTYCEQIDPINDIFDPISVHKADWNSFEKFSEKKLFEHFPQLLTLSKNVINESIWSK